MALRIGFFGLGGDALELVRDCFWATENGLYWDLSVEASSMVLRLFDDLPSGLRLTINLELVRTRGI